MKSQRVNLGTNSFDLPKTALHSFCILIYRQWERDCVDFSSSENIIALDNVVLAKRAGCIDPEPSDDARRVEMMVAWKCIQFGSIFIWCQTNTTLLKRRGKSQIQQKSAWNHTVLSISENNRNYYCNILHQTGDSVPNSSKAVLQLVKIRRTSW